MVWRRWRRQDAVSDWDRIEIGEAIHGKRARVCSDCHTARRLKGYGQMPVAVRERSKVAHLIEFDNVGDGMAITSCGRYLAWS